MAAPATPSNVYVQQGNGEVYVSWDITAGATSYSVLRSTDGVNFTQVATPVVTNYLDNTVTVGTQYWYQVEALNGTDASAPSDAQWVVPTVAGTISLGELRLRAQQRADRVNSNFVTLPEWNDYINQSLFELYDLIETSYEDYYLAVPLQITTDGSTSSYPLPNGINYNKALPFYKLVGVDLSLNNTNNAKVTVQRFNFIARNSYVYPNITSSSLGVFNLRYKVMGNNIMFIPTPASGQIMTLWYTPRMVKLLKDTDITDGINGWYEYVIVDAAIKALQKEESDVSALMMQKQQLIDRIQVAASNRDVSEPATISQTRRFNNNGGWGGPGFDGAYGGF